jgi:uncharacterized protein (TIGR03067 family)
MRIPLTLILSLLCSLFAGQGKQEKRPADKLDGVYRLIKVVLHGEPGPNLQTNPTIVTIKEDQMSFDTKGQSLSILAIILDAAKSPKHITMKVVKGPGLGKSSLGIYKVEKKILTICLVLEGDGKRPVEFAAPKGSLNCLYVLEKTDGK